MNGTIASAIAVVVLLILAGVAATARAALNRVSSARAQRMLEENRSGAANVVALLDDSTRTWASLSLVALMSLVASATISQAALTKGMSTSIATTVSALVFGIVGYLVVAAIPRSIAISRADDAACSLAAITRLLVAIAKPLTMPLVWGVTRLGSSGEDVGEVQLTEEAIRDLIDEAEGQGVEPAERQMLHSIFELSDTMVREIMVPRPDVVMVSETLPLDSVVEVILAHGYSRIPVHRGESRDDVSGLLYAKDVLRRIHTAGSEDGPWTDLIRAPYVVPELKSVDGLLRELQAEQVHLAVVIDEYGAMAGIVTIEDVLEEIVGEIVDEYDSEEDLVTELEDGRWRVDARLPVGDLAKLVNATLPDQEWDSVGGLLFGTLGHIPRPGEAAEIDAVRITAERVRGRRIAEVIVERLAIEDDVAGEGDTDADAS